MFLKSSKAFSISLKKQSDTTSFSSFNSASADDIHVIEIERDRIDKPWNNWIKAVTVDAESEEAKEIVGSLKSSETRTRTDSLRAKQNDRKISFEEWVLHKAEMEAMELKKDKDHESKNNADEESRWSKGKNFEQWKKEKAEHDRKLREEQIQKQREIDLFNKNNAPDMKKGKSFEEWQSEYEQRERTESMIRKEKLDKVKSTIILKNRSHSLREKCSCSEFFWSVFSCIRTEYGEIRRSSPYLLRMRENTDQKNSENGHFSRTKQLPLKIDRII